MCHFLATYVHHLRRTCHVQSFLKFPRLILTVSRGLGNVFPILGCSERPGDLSKATQPVEHPHLLTPKLVFTGWGADFLGKSSTLGRLGGCMCCVSGVVTG